MATEVARSAAGWGGLRDGCRAGDSRAVGARLESMPRDELGCGIKGQCPGRRP